MNADRLARIVDNCDMSSWHAVAPTVGIYSPPYHPADIAEWLEHAEHTAVGPATTLLNGMAAGAWSLEWYPPSGGRDFTSQIRFGVRIGGERWYVWSDKAGRAGGRVAVYVGRFPRSKK